MKHKLNILPLIVFVLFSQVIFAQHITGFSEQIYLNENGNADIKWNLIISGNDPSELKIPWNFSYQGNEDALFTIVRLIDKGQGRDSVVSDPMLTAPCLIQLNGVPYASVKLNGQKSESKYQISFKVKDFFGLDKKDAGEFGDYAFKYRFINTSLPQLKDFESKIVLPPGFVIVSVDETIPKQTEDNPVSPFQLGRNGSGNSITLKPQKFKLGEHVFVKMDIKRDEKSFATLIIFSILGLLYLFFFKDLIANKKNNEDQNSDKLTNLG
jgi:hypothetical protein